jgi:hypothetical protein
VTDFNVDARGGPLVRSPDRSLRPWLTIRAWFQIARLRHELPKYETLHG